MEAPKPPLCTLLLQSSEPSLHDYNHLLSGISKYYTRLHVSMRDEALRDQIMLNPERTITRLQRAFSILKDQKMSAPAAEGIFKSVVGTLVNSPDHLLTPELAFQLVGSSLSIVTRYPGAYLQLVADLFLTQEGMFERLVADEKRCSAIKSLLLSKKTYLDFQTLCAITERLILMCDSCSGHGVSEISESWYRARTLMSTLKSLIQSHREENHKTSEKENLPPLENMRALNPDDKKTSQTLMVKSQESSFKIPQSVLDILKSLNGPQISSIGHLLHALEFIQNEKIPELLHKALDSFPCRLCLERVTGTTSTFAGFLDHRDCQALTNSHSIDIFGKKVGLWKVLLSDAAMKNAKKLARAGDFSRVEQKLRELASGAWKGKDLSRLTGSKKQRQEMIIPILQAHVSRTMSILWHLDVGFEHQSPGVQQQIVKVWQITSSDDEVDAAINQIISLQSYIAPEIARLCLTRPGQHPNGVFFPNKLGPTQGVYAKMKPMGAARIDHALIEMSNKFFNVTEPFLKSIVSNTDLEEFPFDLSPEEMEIIGHFNTSSLILGRSGTGKTTCLLFKILAKHRARQKMPDGKAARQLLLTRSPYLAAKLQTYARSLINTQFEKEAHGTPSYNEKMESFFALKDEDFPFSTNAELQALDKPKVVDFNVFKTEYWSCLSGMVPSGCSPELLFAGIMGVIKGSAISASTLMPLNRAEYLSNSSKASPAFASEVEREVVYRTFERYERQKKQRHQIDELDRVIDLLKLLKGDSSLESLIRHCFEEVYIQDLRCLDIVLLLSCLSDARGIHLAGDTAQCISKDSAFRFPEIKALFYDYYEVISKELNQPSIAKPVQFMLAKNYRSHQGILSFASWVMTMLWNGFPETIDKLDPEIGQTGGPKPIIFAGFDSSILSAKMIGLVKLNDQIANFGAEQVILVRDDASKSRLQAQIGDISLVLTILESKGMEFDDVLVYDFFGSSGLGSSYRCLYLLAHKQHTKFDARKHAALCSELKHLYVAVTRARKHLWFMETIEASIDPVLQALSVHGQTDLAELVRKKDRDVAVKVQVLRAGGSVDPERWLKRAAHLLHQKNFADALFCYRKANDSRGMTHSQAWLYEQEARSLRALDDLEGSTSKYEQAIACFLELNLFSDAADCYQALERYDKAAEIWKSQGQLPKAAAFYEKGGHLRQASDCFHLHGDYEQAIEVLRRGKEFGELIQYIKRHGHRLPLHTLTRYSRLCNILLRQGRISTDLRATTIDLLGSDVEKLSFFKEFEMFDQMRSLYKERHRWFEYYELSVAVGDLPEAMNTLLTQKLLPVIDKKVAEMILHYSMAETLLNHRHLIDSRPELEKDLLQSSRSTPLEKTALQWLSIFNLIDDYEGKSAQASFKSLGASPILVDFFSLFSIVYQSEIKLLERDKLMNLPMDILTHVIRLIQNMEFGELKDSEGLMLVCGLWSSPKNSNQMTVLPWSPLRTDGLQMLEDMSLEALLTQARQWIRERFFSTVEAFQSVAFNLFKDLFPRRCKHFLYRGTCLKARAGECHFFHEKPSHDDCFLKLTCLLNVSEVLSRLSILYYHRLMPESFCVQYLGMRRRWLHLLLNELIFISSFEHSAEAISKIGNLLHSPMFFATTSSIENLLFYRMQEEWHEIYTFSGIFEQLQMAHVLGPRVALSYARALAKKKSYILGRRRRESNPLNNTFSAVQAVDQIRWAISEANITDFYSRVREFLICVERAEATELRTFHSVMAIFELVATYIVRQFHVWGRERLTYILQLCIVNYNNAIMVPSSWAIQYLPVIFKAPLAWNHFYQDSDRNMQLGLLKALIGSFCKITESLEHAISRHNFTIEALSHRSSPVVHRKRIFDYLTTIILNLHAYTPLPRGFADMWEKAQQVIINSAPPSFVCSTAISKFRDEVTRQYAGYNDKDKLQVICLDDNNKCPAFLRSFVTTASPQVKLSTLLESSSGEDKRAQTTLAKDAADADEYTRHELEVIISLQSRWRRVMKILADARCLKRSNKGQIFLQLFALCQQRFNTLPGSARVSAKEKIRIRKLIFTNGVDIISELNSLYTSLRRLKEKWKSCLENPHVTAEEIEELDTVHGHIRPLEVKLEQIAQLWSLKGLSVSIIMVTAKSHGEKAREAQRTIWAVKQEIEVVRSQLEEVAKY
ncbi:uncharacterized protein N7477_004636 [Penicillium maclennaniae]|uniref:uncharacterized protein n=1 Tax=Penicillium maclennaniae TaxID=1343394 RepID=UPI00254175C9|nr:uncharacterized protein N7477_004636 [Penicillium maclennaniae]KAJ5674702.1 hypothetical protein N7477_004636 [Penicillium maclennaniae]